MKWRPDKTFSGALISCPKRKGLSDDANDRVNRDRLERMFYGGDVAGEVNREAPAQAELRPPMVSVKLPKSVLGVFHLFSATKLPFFLGLKIRQMNHFELRLLLALIVRFGGGQGSLLSAHVKF
jgi:hypothetical protein